jgi:hypothetical protein
VEGVVKVNEAEVIKMALEEYARNGRGAVCIIVDHNSGTILGKYVSVEEIGSIPELAVEEEYVSNTLIPRIEVYDVHTSCIAILIVYWLR